MRSLKQFLLYEAYNEGDIMEAIFAIAVANYLADDKISIDKITRARKRVIPAIAAKRGGVRQVITNFREFTKDIKRKGQPRRIDKFQVDLEIKLKSEKNIEKSGLWAFGHTFKSVDQVPTLKTKIINLATQARTSSAFRGIAAFKQGIIDNMTSDDVLFNVIADGLEGEQKGRDEGVLYKGDVKLTIKATDRKTGKPILIPRKPKGSEINFSLKSDSSTIENRSPYDGMIEIAEKFGISFNSLSEYKPLTIKITGAKGTAVWHKQIELKKKLVRQMYNEITSKLEKLDRKAPFTPRCFEFLSKAAFGPDHADIIDISKSKIKEITQANVDDLQKSGILIDVKNIAVKGDVEEAYRLVFFKAGGDPDEKEDRLFQTRLRIRTRTKGGLELKFLIEVGSLPYLKHKPEE